MSDCSSGSCGYHPPIDSRKVAARSKDELRYANLWVTIELPKLLEGKKQ